MENLVKESTRFVVKNAKSVKINKENIAKLAEVWHEKFAWPAGFHLETADKNKLLDYLIVLDSLNFCFWSKKNRWKIKYKGKEYNGYYALARALEMFFENEPQKANLEYLSNISFNEFKNIFQGGKNLLFLKKRWQIARTVSRSIVKNYGTSEKFVESANHKFSELVRLVYKKLPSFNDIFSYQGRKVYLLKRAQILASDIWGAFNGKGIGRFEDLDYLTCFPDYKVPQILNHLGILEYSPSLQKKINSRRLIAMGSADEVEIRSCTVQAVEMLKEELAKRKIIMPSFQVDWILWYRSKKEKLKHPYHLTKTIFY